jgi:hypothetical protein
VGQRDRKLSIGRYSKYRKLADFILRWSDRTIVPGFAVEYVDSLLVAKPGSPGDKAILLLCGRWGERWRNICKAHKYDFVAVEVPYGKSNTPESLEAALKQAQAEHVAVEGILMHRYRVNKKVLGAALSAYFRCPFMDYDETRIPSREHVQEISPAYLKANFWIPLQVSDDSVTVMIDDPQAPSKIQDIRRLFPGKIIERVVGFQDDILKYVNRMYEAPQLSKVNESLSAILGQLDTQDGGDSASRASGSSRPRTSNPGLEAPPGIASRCGSADVFEALGVNISASPSTVERTLRDTGIAFFFAPTFHPSMKHAAQTRRELGIRTAFNLLGPLTNPAGATRQIVGVPRSELTELLARALLMLGSTRAWVVHGADGIDEISTTGYTKVSECRGGAVNTFYVHPADFGLAKAAPVELKGGDAADNAAIIRDVLAGTRGARRDIVLLNAGVALFVAGRVMTIREGIAAAAAAVDSGAAGQRLQKMIESSHMEAAV